ncbi:hypothetical protein Hanom_Chr09g00778011 [Helianthus anomalus]
MQAQQAWLRVATGLASTVAGHAICVDHWWLRVAIYVATMVSAGHAMVSSRNRTRNLWSRLVRLWSRVATRCFESQPGVSTPQHLLILHSCTIQ